jgi:hypothetical protein
MHNVAYTFYFFRCFGAPLDPAPGAAAHPAHPSLRRWEAVKFKYSVAGQVTHVKRKILFFYIEESSTGLCL